MIFHPSKLNNGLSPPWNTEGNYSLLHRAYPVKSGAMLLQRTTEPLFEHTQFRVTPKVNYPGFPFHANGFKIDLNITFITKFYLPFVNEHSEYHGACFFQYNSFGGKCFVSLRQFINNYRFCMDTNTCCWFSVNNQRPAFACFVNRCVAPA